VRPLERVDARPVALLFREISREYGAEPLSSIEATEALFDTPWLRQGAGLVMEDRDGLVGMGWVRDMDWNGQLYVDFGLHLRESHRSPDIYPLLTDPLLDLARDRGQKFGTDQALACYRSIDTGHPPIIRQLGFRDLPTTMIGFRHSLDRMPPVKLPRNIVFRPSRLPDELQVLIALGEQAFDDRKNVGEPMAVDYWELAMKNDWFSPGQVIVAEHRGEPVGYAFIWVGAAEAKEVGLYEVAVLPRWRKKGIGSALTVEALKWSRDRGSEALLTGAFSTNRSIAQYWRLGFRPEAIRTYYFFTRPLE
jgi:ribosomal protein S18 acetylase RimI-like enzyme